MKTRNGFVSNSSSSSFIISLLPDDPRLGALYDCCDEVIAETYQAETEINEITEHKELLHFFQRNWNAKSKSPDELIANHKEMFDALEQGHVIIDIDVDYYHQDLFDFISSNFDSEIYLES